MLLRCGIDYLLRTDHPAFDNNKPGEIVPTEDHTLELLDPFLIVSTLLREFRYDLQAGGIDLSLRTEPWYQHTVHAMLVFRTLRFHRNRGVIEQGASFGQTREHILWGHSMTRSASRMVEEMREAYMRDRRTFEPFRKLVETLFDASAINMRVSLVGEEVKATLWYLPPGASWTEYERLKDL